MFAPNAPMTKMCIFGVKKMPTFTTNLFGLQMHRIYYLGVSHDKICIFGGRGCQTCPFLGSQMLKFAKTFLFTLNSTKSHLRVSHDPNLQNLPIWGLKMQRFTNKCPQKSLGISHDQNLHIWGVKNYHFGGQKCQNLKKKKRFCAICP